MDTSKVKNMEYLFFGCTNLASINLSKFDTSSLENADFMFKSCSSLISIDLSNFRTTNLKSMHDMFGNCTNLLFVNLSSFVTSNVENMRGIFYKCEKLKYLDLQFFSASSLTNLEYTFTDCYKIVYINLRNFKITNTNTVSLKQTLRSHPSYTKYCIEDLETKNFILSDKTVDCSDLCFQYNVMFEFDNNRCICNEKYKFEYNNKCYQKCPDETFPIQIELNKYIYNTTVLVNYYLDNNDNIYKECYSSCKKCVKSGNEENNNCQECKSNYRFINEPFSVTNNCYEECSDYSYFTGKNKYYCTSSCSIDGYNKVIGPEKKCIDDCKNDNKYIYEYNDECVENCPENKKIDFEKK